jgi:hypothetical protein
VHDLYVVQHAAGLGLQVVERAEDRAQSELVPGARHGEIEVAPGEGALQRLAIVRPGERDHGVAEGGRDGLECEVGPVGVQLQAPSKAEWGTAMRSIPPICFSQPFSRLPIAPESRAIMILAGTGFGVSICRIRPRKTVRVLRLRPAPRRRSLASIIVNPVSR